MHGNLCRSEGPAAASEAVNLLTNKYNIYRRCSHKRLPKKMNNTVKQTMESQVAQAATNTTQQHALSMMCGTLTGSDVHLDDCACALCHLAMYMIRLGNSRNIRNLHHLKMCIYASTPWIEIKGACNSYTPI